MILCRSKRMCMELYNVLDGLVWVCAVVVLLVWLLSI
jgi:hypothetical protein